MLMYDGYLTAIPGYWAVLPALPVGVWIWLRHRSGAVGATWTGMALLALVHVTAVVALTIFPIPIAGQDFYRDTRGMTEDNLVPFASILAQVAHPLESPGRQLVGNLLALMPLGVYGPYFWPALRDWRRFAIVAVAVSTSIEVTQYAGSLMEGFTYRVTDVDDAILNTTGAMLAFRYWPRVWPWLLPRVAARAPAGSIQENGA